jgi:hypothetical protein
LKERYIVLTIDTIAELFKDYCDPKDLPDTAIPLKLLYNGTDLALEMFSEDWPEGLGPLKAHFDIKRIYGVSAR